MWQVDWVVGVTPMMQRWRDERPARETFLSVAGWASADWVALTQDRPGGRGHRIVEYRGAIPERVRRGSWT
jgi:hypothetical protein